MKLKTLMSGSSMPAAKGSTDVAEQLQALLTAGRCTKGQCLGTQIAQGWAARGFLRMPGHQHNMSDLVWALKGKGKTAELTYSYLSAPSSGFWRELHTRPIWAIGLAQSADDLALTPSSARL